MWLAFLKITQRRATSGDTALSTGGRAVRSLFDYGELN